MPPALMTRLREHVESAYPREGCGVLLGTIGRSQRLVTRLEPTSNRWSERNDRYLVNPDVVRRLLEQEEAGGPRVLGFYHSHPDAKPRPSGTDREFAWPWYHYLILEVHGSQAGIGRVWELEEGVFVERELRLAEQPEIRSTLETDPAR